MGMTGSKKHLKPLKTRELGKAKIERRLTASWRLRFSWNFAGRRPWVTDDKSKLLAGRAKTARNMALQIKHLRTCSLEADRLSHWQAISRLSAGYQHYRNSRDPLEIGFAGRIAGPTSRQEQQFTSATARFRRIIRLSAIRGHR